MKETLFYENLGDAVVKCNLCSHRCRITDSKREICGVRENRNGTLYSLVYEKVVARAVDPIEKKATCHMSVSTDLKNAGGIYPNKSVVVDGTLLTSRFPADLPDFCSETLKLLEKSEETSKTPNIVVEGNCVILLTARIAYCDWSSVLIFILLPQLWLPWGTEPRRPYRECNHLL